MNYFWSLLFIAASVNAAYNPFFKPLAKQKKAPLAAPVERAMPLPPLLKPAFEPNLALPKAPFDLSQLTYNCYLGVMKKTGG